MTASTCIQWIRDELEAHDDLRTLHPPLVDTPSLCAFVTDGRALCLLTNVVLPPTDEQELPKKLQRSLKQLSKFHALERVQFFIKWCRTRAKLEEHQVFTTVQLLDEVNETAVSETIIALRNKTRPGLKLTKALSGCFAATDKSNARVDAPTRSTSDTSTANTANRLSSFLTKFPSVPVVATRTSQSKPVMTQHRVSLTSSVTSSNPSPRELDDVVPGDDVTNSSSSKSRLRIPSIFKGNNPDASLASATSRSSVISNSSSTASSNKEEGHESRSWSSKLSAFSRHSSLSNTSAPKTPLAGDLDNSDTPSSSPVASPHNRVSIPSAFSAPASTAPRSMSKLSAFLSTVDTTAPVTSVLSAPSGDKKESELAEEATPIEDVKPAITGTQAEEEELPAAVVDEILFEKESTSMDVEAEHKPLEEPVSSAKLIAFLQAVEPGSTTLPQQMLEKDEVDFGAVEAEDVILTEKEAPAVEKEVAYVEDEIAGTESEVSDVEVELAATHEEEVPTEEDSVLEMHDEVAMETQETLEEEVEEAPEDETLERQKDEIAIPVAPVTLVLTEIVQENERLLSENDAFTLKLETAETAVTTKHTELEAVKQELELLKAKLAEEQARAHEKLLAAEKKQEVLSADAAEARAELAKIQQTSSESTSAAKVAKAQVEELAAQNKSLAADLTNLREEVQTLEQSVQLARDSEEAARYAAQVAFAARDSADEVNQHLKDRLAHLEK